MDPLLIAAWGFVALIVGLVIAVLYQRATPGVDKLAPALQAEATSRGWTVTTARERGSQVIQWSGADDGIQWTAEALEQSQHRNLRRTTRWQSRGLQATTGPILLMGVPEGVEIPKAQPAGTGMLASLAMKAILLALDKGIDMYFGVEVGRAIDANALQRVERAENGLDGYAVMAADPADVDQILTSEVIDAIGAAARAGPRDKNRKLRPWVLIWEHGVSVARPDFARSAADIEPLMRTGVAIAKAVRW
jgi:hypothetical protein